MSCPFLENVNQQSILNTENLVVDDPIPSTSSGQVSSLTYYSVLDFSSDDSVRDPCYELPRLPITSSSSTCDEISMNPNVSPKKSIRTIKREKKLKRNLGQAYKTLKGKCISDRTMN